jgi:hypothetical protein
MRLVRNIFITLPIGGGGGGSGSNTHPAEAPILTPLPVHA